MSIAAAAAPRLRTPLRARSIAFAVLPLIVLAIMLSGQTGKFKQSQPDRFADPALQQTTLQQRAVQQKIAAHFG